MVRLRSIVQTILYTSAVCAALSHGLELLSETFEDASWTKRWSVSEPTPQHDIYTSYWHSSISGLNVMSSESLKLTTPLQPHWDGKSALSFQMSLQLPPAFDCGIVQATLKSDNGRSVVTFGINVCGRWAKHFIFKLYDPELKTEPGDLQCYSIPDSANGSPKHRAFTDSRIHHYRVDLQPNFTTGDWSYALYLDGYPYAISTSLIKELEHPILRQAREVDWPGRPENKSTIPPSQTAVLQAKESDTSGRWRDDLQARFKAALSNLSVSQVEIETSGDCSGVGLFGIWVLTGENVNHPTFATPINSRLPTSIRDEESKAFYAAIAEEEKKWRAGQKQMLAERARQNLEVKLHEKPAIRQQVGEPTQTQRTEL